MQANAQALCTLANGYAENGTWDDLMMDAQKFKAAAMLQDFLDKSDRLLLEITNNP